MGTFHCGKKGKLVTKCYLLGGEDPPECKGCKRYKPTWKPSQFTDHGPDPRQGIDTSNVRPLILGPLPEPKRSRLKKVFFVKDQVTGKQRRVYRADHEPRATFVSALCFLCSETVKQVQSEFCKGRGHINEVLNRLKDKERLSLTLEGRQHFLNKSIDQIIKRPEMKSLRSFKSQTLAEWRRVHCGQLCIRQNPGLKISIGRREKE